MKISFNYLRRLNGIICALVLCSSVQAIPAWRGALQFKQADGTTLTYYQRGDEHMHAFFTTDGLPLAQRDGSLCYATILSDGSLQASSQVAHDVDLRSAEEISFVSQLPKTDYSKIAKPARVRGVSGTSDFPTKGNVKGLILLVNFSDVEFQSEYDQATFQSMMNDQGYSDYGSTGSARDYFLDQSTNQFQPQFDVVGPFTVSHGFAYYGANTGTNETDGRPGEMVVEACQLAHDSANIDFSQYDYNNDGEVDFVYVIYAGYGESYGASANTIWPHAANISDFGLSLTLDGKNVGRYACSCELKYTTGNTLEGIGTFCHEFGHVLGLPDLYNTFYSSSIQLGSWDIMDQGSYNNDSRTPPAYSAFERYSLGWLDYEELSEPAYGVTLPELTSSNKAYRISTAYDNEYFVLENRQQKGWDAYQAGTGMMVTHVTYEESFWTNNTVNASSNPHVDIVEADNTQTTSEAGDLYPGSTNNTSLTDYSTPNTLAWDGTLTEKGITNIKETDSIISFDFMHDKLRRPVLNDPTDITDHSFTASWNAVDEAIGYRLTVDEVLPDSLNPILIDEDFSGMTEGTYPKSDVTDISEEMDSYTKESGWYGTDVYSCGGYVRIGSYGKSGMLYTPLVTPKYDSLTVAARVRSYTGKSVSYTVQLMIEAQGSTQSQTFKSRGTENEVVIRFAMDEGVENRIVFTTNNERLFIDDIRVLDGYIDSAEVWTINPEQWVFDSLTTTQQTVTGLLPARTYRYSVIALDSVELKNSLSSNVMEVTTLSTADAIQSTAETVSGWSVSGRLLTLTASSQPVMIADISGRTIYRSSCINGTVNIVLPSTGVYLVKVGTTVKKILVK
ncbi:MAG: M6 family metalloprotease domain-containing protein [Prevotella sp.]|jgi:M6 family metalloprotease-like protein